MRSSMDSEPTMCQGVLHILFYFSSAQYGGIDFIYFTDEEMWETEVG